MKITWTLRSQYIFSQLHLGCLYLLGIGVSWGLCKVYLASYSLPPGCGWRHQKIPRGHPRPAPSLHPPSAPAQVIPAASRADEEVWAPCPGTLVLLGREQL